MAFIFPTDSSGQTRRLQQFQLNIEPAERIEELKLEVTAPMIAPKPNILTSSGVACRSSKGSVSAGLALSSVRRLGLHAYPKAANPSSNGGKVKPIVSKPAAIECH
ncbi:MAG TPA: hypothetical protein VGL91_16175 [Acidobacteriota bacterium]